MQVCRRSDPELVECIKKSVELVQTKLHTGYPEYNIPSLEPLVLKELIAAEGTGGIKITCRNVLAYGSSNFIIEKLR